MDGDLFNIDLVLFFVICIAAIMMLVFIIESCY